MSKWKKAGRATGQAAMAVKRMEPGRISEAEAAALIAGLGTEPDDEEVEPTTQERVKAARALLMTARSNRANTELLVTMGAVSAVVDLLSHKAAEAQECACLATVALAEIDTGCTVAAEMGALPRLLTMSSSPAGVFDKRVVHSATAALAALARLTANGEELAELRVTELLSALCSALEGGTQAQSRVTAETALKLVRLCREGLGYEERGSQGSSVRRAVGELGGISLLVSLLSSTAAPVQLAALDGLKELCKLESNRMKILETDGVEMLVSLSEAGSSAAVQRRAKSTVDAFCESAVCRQKVGELRVRSMVLELRLPGHGEQLGPTLRALSALCRESQLNRQSAIAANALLDVTRVLSSPEIGLQRAAVDLLKELAREDGAADAAGELGAVEPLMSLLSAATARNDSGLQRAISKCLQLLQRAAPNRERLARLRVSTLVGKLKLAEEQGLSQYPDDGKMDAETLCDHAKSITQLCRDDHSNVARFGELGALPRLVGLLGRGHGPTVERSITSALRELGWDEENRLEIAELKMAPMVRQLEGLVSGDRGGAYLDEEEIAGVVNRVCAVCAEDDNNRIALNVCGGLQPLVELTLSDAAGPARSALNAVMKELAKNGELKERIMQLLLDARSRAAVVDTETSSGGGGGGYESAGSSDFGRPLSGSSVGNAEALDGVDVERHIAMSAQTNAALERHVAEHPQSSSGDSGGAASDLDLGLEDALAATRSTLADMPDTTGNDWGSSAEAVGGVGGGSGGGGGARAEGVLRQRERRALQDRLRSVEEDLSGAHRRRVQLEQQSAMLLERNKTLEAEATARASREAEAQVRPAFMLLPPSSLLRQFANSSLLIQSSSLQAATQSDALVELERSHVEIKVKDKVLEQQQVRTHAIYPCV